MKKYLRKKFTKYSICLLALLLLLIVFNSNYSNAQSENVWEKYNDDTIKKIKVIIDQNKWPQQDKMYDGWNTFSYTIPLSDESVIIAGDQKNNIPPDDVIVVKGEVGKADVGNYDQFTITDIELKCSQDIYDDSELHKLINKNLTLQKENGEGKFRITKAEIEGVSIEQVVLNYRTDTMNLLQTKQEVKFDREVNVNKDIVVGEFLNLMEQDAQIELSERGCTFLNWKNTANNSEYILENNNIKFKLLANTFPYCYVRERIVDSDIISKVTMTQGGRMLGNGASGKVWCDKTTIYTEINGSEYTEFYDTAAYKKLSINCLEDVKEYSISDTNYENPKNELDIEVEEGKEAYYVMLFSKGGRYSTAAAVIRVIEEKAVMEDYDYPTTITAQDGNRYCVINLFIDTSGDSVAFENLQGMPYSTGDDGEIGKKYMGESKVGFHIENTGFGVKEVQYAICKLDENTDTILIKDIEIPKTLKILKKTEDNNYEIDVPQEEGVYAVYVITENENSQRADYISFGIIVDVSAPVIKSPRFYEIEDGKENDITGAGKGDKKILYSQKTVKAEFEIIERNLVGVDVKITATDKNKKTLFSEQYIEQIENTLKEELLNHKKGVYEFTQSANYCIEISAWDAAGLSGLKATYYLTVDSEKPSGKVTVKGLVQNVKQNEKEKQGKINMIIKKFTEFWSDPITGWINIVFNVFSKEKAEIILEGDDTISPVTIYYYIANENEKIEGLEDLEGKEWEEYSRDREVWIEVNKKMIVYERVEDAAGNITYLSSKGIITDNKKPEVKISYKDKANQNGLYRGALSMTVMVEDKEVFQEYASSGLQYVSYQIEKNNKVIQSETIYETKAKDYEYTKTEFPIIIKEDFNNSDDVRLYVTAVDNAGNKENYMENIRVDNVKPEITVTYDNNNAVNEKYYNQLRTATVTIKERNLNPEDVKLSIRSKNNSKVTIGKWTHNANVGKSDDAVYVCKVTFFKDDDYKFAVSCTDMAGNKAEKDYLTQFTLDTTAPEISVSYNGQTLGQNTYYNKEITAVITITEHNFNAEKVQIFTSAGENSGGTPVISDFNSNGDIHTATIQYNTDGKYNLDIAYTDEADNKGKRFRGSQFVMDLTEPELEIKNIENYSANKGEVKPVITCTDANYDQSLVSISVVGANSGEINLKAVGYTISDVKNGQQYHLDFPKTEEMDDIYTLTVNMQDKAGNKKEASITFSVNRYGSVYTLGEETKKWLCNGECAYIPEGKEIVIVETNVNEIENQNISYSHSGIGSSIVDIKEMSACSEEEKRNQLYYKVLKVQSENKWCQNRYEINSENFTKEGRYTISIDSTDAAGNHTSNASNGHNNGKLLILFAVDKTAPSVVISGLNGKGIYNKTEHMLYLDAQDNLALDKVTVYVDDKEYGTYTAEDIEELNDGLIPVRIKQSRSVQKIRVVAKDMAGNILGIADDAAKNSRKFEEVDILVTTNIFVQFLHKTWLLISVLLGIVSIAGGISVAVFRQKKKEL